jgi:histidyl-tRNA synthetase
MAQQARFQAPTGTRDMYPLALARRRYIEKAWRTISIRHGFDEVDGPTFEHLDLYTVKSGDGIVSELFSFTRAGGEKDYALRPEFTPSLARLYTAQAGQLPKPTKWFWQNTCFRAERPQRGRLREFLQWNCDILGAENRSLADAEIIAVVVDLLEHLGLKPSDLQVRLNDRAAAVEVLTACGVTGDPIAALGMLDKRAKMKPEAFAELCTQSGLRIGEFDQKMATVAAAAGRVLTGTGTAEDATTLAAMPGIAGLAEQLKAMGIGQWCAVDASIVRGLAYYTGTVFEVIVDGERAVAGGGRYDNLIELFGGPATPAIGFGMGDVVLSLVLQDKKLMPSDADLVRQMGLSPDVYVISNGTPEADAALSGTVATLRRTGLHTRRSYKATKNIGKLLKDAGDAGSRFAVILESGVEATVKNMGTGEQTKVPLAELQKAVGG